MCNRAVITKYKNPSYFLLDVTSKYGSYPPVIHEMRPGANNSDVMCTYVLHKVKFPCSFLDILSTFYAVVATLQNTKE